MIGDLHSCEAEGLIPRMLRLIFEKSKEEINHYTSEVSVSMIELYQEKIRDLIDESKNNLNVREDKRKGCYIEDLSYHTVESLSEAISILNKGTNNRSVGSTNMNEHSSRSHTIFIVNLKTTSCSENEDCLVKESKLYLVDLAGSEKISKTGYLIILIIELKDNY